MLAVLHDHGAARARECVQTRRRRRERGGRRERARAHDDRAERARGPPCAKSLGAIIVTCIPSWCEQRADVVAHALQVGDARIARQRRRHRHDLHRRVAVVAQRPDVPVLEGAPADAVMVLAARRDGLDLMVARRQRSAHVKGHRRLAERRERHTTRRAVRRESLWNRDRQGDRLRYVGSRLQVHHERAVDRDPRARKLQLSVESHADRRYARHGAPQLAARGIGEAIDHRTGVHDHRHAGDHQRGASHACRTDASSPIAR